MAMSKAANIFKPYATGLLKSKPVLRIPTCGSPKIFLRFGSGSPRLLRTKVLDSGPAFFRDMIRYWLYGFVPAMGFLGLTNLFIGNAVLHDYDPEKYDPEEYEFYDHPIQRWIARYLTEDPKVIYYRSIFHLEANQRVDRQISFINHVHQLQAFEGEGMMEMLDRAAIPRQLRDELDQWVDEQGWTVDEPKR